MQKSDWKKCKLGDVAEITSSKRIFLADYVKEGVPFYRSKEIIERSSGRSITTPLFISEEKYEQIINKYGAPIAGDLLLTSVGTLGIPYRVSPTDKFYFKDGNLTWFRKLNNILCDYLYYFFLSPIGKEKLALIAIGSTQKALTINALQGVTLSLPPLDEQKRIADILGAFDDKIELLQKQNKTLEDMAKALFKSWFVDFDVVRAKQKGLPKADIMREYHLTDELYDLFPSGFADSPLGPIPSGWEVKNVGELLAFSIGGGWGNEEESESFPIKAPVIRGTDIPSLRSSGAYNDVPVRFHKKSNHTSRELKEGDIVLEVAGGSKGQPVGRALFVSDYIIKSLPKVICASFCKLLRPNKKLLLSELFYLYLDMMYQTGEIEQYQVQSTGISNFQFKQFCEDKQFVIPNTELQKKLSLNVYIDKIGNNKKQIQTLTELRDTLLPRLISGKIRV